jgi:hypothetical protein
MCYQKPGPRCSASAAVKLAKARRECLIFLKTHTLKNSYSEYAVLQEVLDKAEAEYEITPAGIRELERVAENYPNERTLATLEKARILRAARINAVKSKLTTDASHNLELSKEELNYQFTKLSQDGDVLSPISQDHSDVELLLKESEAWSYKLNAEEMNAVKWYTQDGYADVNGSLASKSYSSATSPERIKEVVTLLDSAIDKSSFDREVILYRRHFLYTEDGNYKHVTDVEKDDMFQVGSTYEPRFFMSTSLDPNNAPPKDGGISVFFEIKAKRAASLSAIANSGTLETEYLLPRDASYKVVSNSNKVTVRENDDGSRDRTLTVIQLEEI